MSSPCKQRRCALEKTKILAALLNQARLRNNNKTAEKVVYKIGVDELWRTYCTMFPQVSENQRKDATAMMALILERFRGTKVFNELIELLCKHCQDVYNAINSLRHEERHWHISYYGEIVAYNDAFRKFLRGRTGVKTPVFMRRIATRLLRAFLEVKLPRRAEMGGVAIAFVEALVSQPEEKTKQHAVLGLIRLQQFAAGALDSDIKYRSKMTHEEVFRLVEPVVSQYFETDIQAQSLLHSLEYDELNDSGVLSVP